MEDAAGCRGMVDLQELEAGGRFDCPFGADVLVAADRECCRKGQSRKSVLKQQRVLNVNYKLLKAINNNNNKIFLLVNWVLIKK